MSLVSVVVITVDFESTNTGSNPVPNWVYCLGFGHSFNFYYVFVILCGSFRSIREAEPML